jgi:hypothetical protein
MNCFAVDAFILLQGKCAVVTKPEVFPSAAFALRLPLKD